MAIAFVQNAHSGNTTVTSHSVSISATGTGNLIVVAIGYDDHTTIVSSITDNAGNTYQQVPGAIGGGSLVEGSTVWYAKNSIAGATSVTVHASTTFNHIVVSVYEFSGADTSAPVDSGNGETQNGTYHSPALSPSLTQELLVSVIYSTAQIMTGVDAPWVGVADATINGFASAYYINPPVSSQQAVFTPHGSGDHSSSISGFFQGASTFIKNLSETQSMAVSIQVPVSKSLSEVILSGDILSTEPIIIESVETIKIADWLSITRSQDDSPFGD